MGKSRYFTTAPQVASVPPVDYDHSVDGKVESEAATTIAEQVPRPDKFESRSLGGHLSREAAEALARSDHVIDLRQPEWISEAWVEGDHYYRQDTRRR